jgi:hypothetical protein
MNVTSEAIAKFAKSHYAVAARALFGDEAPDAIDTLFDSLRNIFGYVNPEGLSHQFHVFLLKGKDLPPLFSDDGVKVDAAGLRELVNTPCCVQVITRELFRVWRSATDAYALSDYALVYGCDGRREMLTAKGHRTDLEEPVFGVSMFCSPTFADLDQALDFYSQQIVRSTSGCQLLPAVWHNKDDRMYLARKPEEVIQKSLTQFLHSRFAKFADVGREQRQDDSHPVDVRMTWFFRGTEAIIEIKWIGRAVRNTKGETTQYDVDRVIKGARQLADYLEMNRERTPSTTVRGYLLVFDARRQGLPANVNDYQSIGRSDAFYFETLELELEPRYDLLRDDFAPPVRMFATPRLLAG